MRHLSRSRIQLGYWHWRASRGGHAVKAAGLGNGEENDASARPRRSVSAALRHAKRLHRTSGEIDPFQFAVGIEADRLAIRRPERVPCAFAAHKAACRG